MYVDNQWELIGTTTIDLSDYVTYDDVTITQALTTGIPAATITVGNTITTIYSTDGSKWNDVSLSKGGGANYAANTYIPQLTSATATSANLATATGTPTKYSIAKYDDHAMLHSATPTAGDKSNKVATTSFVADAITTSITSVAALTTGITIGSIDVNGVTTVFYAPEDTKVTQTDITGSTTGVRPILLSAQSSNKGTITDESLKSDTFLFHKGLDSLIIRRSSSDDFDGRVAVTNSDGKALVEIASYKEGTTTQTGIGLVSAGNNYSSGTAGNAKGLIQIYGENTSANILGSLATTTTYNNYLPTVNNVVLAAGVTTGVGSSTVPVYMASTGELFACTLPTITAPVQSDWKQTTDTELDYIKNKPAIWDSEDYTLPEGATYGNSDTKAVGAVALNLNSNNAKGNYSVSEGYQGSGNRVVTINGVSTTLPYGASGDYSHAEGYTAIAFGANSHAEGSNSVAYGINSHAEGRNSIASGQYSHAEGQGTVASGYQSHAEGYYSTASGRNSHAEGSNSTASDESSHAEGYRTVASGSYSHAEGHGTIASGGYSHAEGKYSAASGLYSHVEGEGIIITAILNAANANTTSYTLLTPVEVSNSNLLIANNMFVCSKNTTGTTNSWTPIPLEKITARTVSGKSLTGFTVANTLFTSAITTGAVQIILPRAKNGDAHVQGQGTVSNFEAQHVSGKWNVQTNGAEIIGNGTDDLHRSNIRTLDWDGNEWLAGKLTVGATPTANMDVATKQYVDNAVSGITPSAISATSTLSTGTEIGSIDINGVTTTLYAPEDTKVKQNDITGDTAVTGYFPVLFSDTTKETTNTIISEAQKTNKFYYNTNLGIFTVQGNGTNNNGGFYVKGDSHNYVTFIINKVGTTSTIGLGAAQLGNQYAAGTEDNSEGVLTIFGEGERGNQLHTLDNGIGNIPGLNKKQYINYLPMVDQAVLAAGVTTGVGSSTVPVYMAPTGELIACTLPTSSSYSLSMTGATITLLADNVAASTITLPIYDGTII